MPLLSIDGKRQPVIGQKPWWQMYERFQGNELHTIFCESIQPHLTRDFIHSGHLGSAVLSEISRSHPNLIAMYSQEALGQLFGMTVWNLIAMSHLNWYFIKEPVEHGDFGATEYFMQS